MKINFCDLWKRARGEGGGLPAERMVAGKRDCKVRGANYEYRFGVYAKCTVYTMYLNGNAIYLKHLKKGTYALFA